MPLLNISKTLNLSKINAQGPFGSPLGAFFLGVFGSLVRLSSRLKRFSDVSLSWAEYFQNIMADFGIVKVYMLNARSHYLVNDP